MRLSKETAHSFFFTKKKSRVDEVQETIIKTITVKKVVTFVKKCAMPR